MLFGTLSDIDFTQDISALDHTNSYSAVPAFTALGEDVARQLAEQLGGSYQQPPGQPALRDNLPRDEAPRILLQATQNQCGRGLAPDSSVSQIICR